MNEYCERRRSLLLAFGAVWLAPLARAAGDEITEYTVPKRRRGMTIEPSGRTDRGVDYEIVTAGSGARPRRSDRVRVHYVGRLSNGAIVDSSRVRGIPLVIAVRDTIEGWQDTLPLMPEGSLWKLHIPSRLAYGPDGAGAVVPPNADMFFEIELLEVLPK